MDVGFFAAHEQHGPSDLLDHVERAEAAGFDTAWTSDHFHPWWHTGAHCGAAWPWLGSALERTEGIPLSTGVTPPVARYHPGLLAQFAATLDSMYPGRFRLTLATGEAMNERPLGFEWPDYPERRARLVDACRIVRRLWDGGFVDYDGHYWDLDGAKLYTEPATDPPLIVAGDGVKTAETAGRFADGFLTLSEFEHYREHLVPALEAGAEKAGRDPEDITRVRQQGVSYAADSDDALDAVQFWTGTMGMDFGADVHDPREIEAAGKEVPRERWDEWGVVTTDVEDVGAAVDAHAEAGFDEVQLISTSPDQDAFIDAMAESVL